VRCLVGIFGSLQATLGLEVGYAGMPTTDTLPRNGVDVGLIAGGGFGDAWSIQGLLSYNIFPNERPLHLGMAGLETVYALDRPVDRARRKDTGRLRPTRATRRGLPHQPAMAHWRGRAWLLGRDQRDEPARPVHRDGRGAGRGSLRPSLAPPVDTVAAKSGSAGPMRWRYPQARARRTRRIEWMKLVMPSPRPAIGRSLPTLLRLG